MDLFVEIVSFQLVTIFAKSSILNVQLGFGYASEVTQFNFRLRDSSEALVSSLSYKVLHFNQLCGFLQSIIILTHLFPMHPFSVSWKHRKTIRFSDVFRE